MARLVYSMLMSLDGYTEDPSGGFEWAMPDAEVHAFVNGLEHGIGTNLYGRRMYETMAVWQTIGADGPTDSPEMDAFADAWRATDKIVYSTTLADVSTPHTRLERSFDPIAVRRLMDAADRDVAVSGPTLAGAALAAGVVDEVHLFAFPVSVGGGTPALPRGVRLDLQLVGTRRFESGVVHLHLRCR